MADSIAVENYKKSVSKIIDHWATETLKLSKELQPVNAEIDKLEASTTPDKKKLDELYKKRDALRKKIEATETSLRVNLMVIQVPPDAPENELIKVPDWLKSVIKNKGIVIGKGVVISPKVDFDFKKKKLKSIGFSIKW